MPYTKANRELTDEQFSEGTTIDGTRIDKAIEDVIDHQNDIPIGDMEAQWMPTTYVMAWGPSRPPYRMLGNAIHMAGFQRYTPDELYGTQNHWFPFLATHNHADEVYPVAEQPIDGFTNEWRQKGFFQGNQNVSELHENQSRASTTAVPNVTPQDINATNNTLPTWTTRLAAAPGVGNSYSVLHRKYWSATFPFYFKDPVIIMGISVFAAQEHPVSFYNSTDLGGGNPCYQVQATGYKSGGVIGPVQFDYTSQPCAVANQSIEPSTGLNMNPGAAGRLNEATGTEYPGEKWTTSSDAVPSALGQNFGNGTVTLSIDNEFLKERRDLNNIAVHKFDLGTDTNRFNRVHNTNSTAGHARSATGGLYTDMRPEYAGGATWGVWVKEQDLNIPVPRDSRVRFSVITNGFRNTQLFEWHIALTVLELVKK